MGKYANHQELAGHAPWSWRRNTTKESLEKGLSRIAPPGMKPKEERTKKFEENTGFKKSVSWHRNWDIAMFGGTELGETAPEEQLRIESLFPPGEKPPYLERRRL